MTKEISAGLQTAFEADAVTVSYCIQIRRKDGRVYRMTDHNVDITVDNGTYDASIPFELGPIDTGSTMTVDNTDLALFCDGTIFDLVDFKKRLFDGAEVEIRIVDWTSLANGSLFVRRGWISQCDYNQNNRVEISIVGMLKLLDYPVARVYSPLCNADFGDSRCKMAVDWSKMYRDGNTYTVGDSVYFYDTSLMTAITLTNPSFEADGSVVNPTAITGWSRLPGSIFNVELATGTPYGSYALVGLADGGANDNAYTSTLYQDIDIGTEAGTTLIDDGKISFAFMLRIRQTSLEDTYKIYLEMYDINGNVVQYYDPGWKQLDDTTIWYGDQCVVPLIATVRTVRCYISFRKIDSTTANFYADNCEAYWWDHTTTSPHGDVIQRYDTEVTDGVIGSGGGQNNIDWGDRSFEGDGAIAYQLSPTITGWEVTGYCQVQGSAHGMSAPHGNLAWFGGTQAILHQTTIGFTSSLTDLELTTAEVDGGDVIVTFAGYFGFSQTIAATAVNFQINFYDAVPSDIGGTGATLLKSVQPFGNPFNPNPDTTGRWYERTTAQRVPASTRAIVIWAQWTGAPVMEGGMDNFVLRKQLLQDPAAANATSNESAPLENSGSLPINTASFGTTAGDITKDGTIIWTADAHHNAFGTVDAVTNNKSFTVTGLTLGDEYYQGAVMKFLSGANRGQTVNVRIWDQSLDAIKLYTELPFTVATGDRFQITTNCLKRYSEDCVTKFANGLNFRGFPYVPGRLAGEDNLVTVTTQST